MKPRELKALIKILRATGVVSYECNGVKLLLDPNFVAPTSKRTHANKFNETSTIQDQLDGMIPQMSDEDWLIATNAPTAEDEMQ